MLSRALQHPRIVIAALGAIAALGFPPLHLWPLSLLGLGAAAILIRFSGSTRSAFFRGWLFGLAHFTASNLWIATAFTHQDSMPAELGWLAVPLLSTYLALFPATAFAAASRLARGRSTLTYALALGGCWILAEWLRASLFTGYAWGPFSLAMLGPFNTPGLGALLPFTGTYALSGLAVLLAVVLVDLLLRRNWTRAGLATVLLAAAMYWPAGPGAEGTLDYTLVQPDLDQDELNDPRQYEPGFLTLAALTARPAEESGRRLVLWPEGVLPDYLREGYPQRYYSATTAGRDPGFARARIARVIGEDSLLLTGTMDLEIEDNRAVAAYNVVSIVDDEGEIVGSYRKAHLVPYGEYLPFRDVLEPLGLSRLVAGTIDFLPGPGPRTIDLGSYGRAGVQICYEIIFSGQVVDGADRPDYIVNPSIDGWFGPSGPPQHLAQARMRAIEEGLPVLRATTTGISGVIDARGVVRQHLGMGEQARLEGKVPPAASPTAFALLGNWLALVWALALLGGSLVVKRRTAH
ncbi:apolipoprotein N-acyltransferase [Alteriqipengyuania lutimaris]|uniref:Apolipoprotein N-acyltransferase n=1 Tax=Alteriqipengyuania lutimaris TaxID=1538146 RepID=A0A395LJL5_9SPHN|nr:apolipoprotein N-acyltransferase [Alteriqipengyuania lutimaris]MBB3034608.1 apolipoprotein N-acyltransferase [Alteriqipengyuania lutimaris]RDS76517.1 apolipoprotein N-acyltransferase [Alteriqipengyuania lutimaris]